MRVERARRVDAVEPHDLRPRGFGGIVGVDDDDLVAMAHRAQDLQQIGRQQRIEVLQHVSALLDSARRRRVGAHQPFGLQLAPQRGGNLVPSISALRVTSVGFCAAGNDADDRGMAERKAQRGLGELDAMRLADRLDPLARARESPCGAGA